MLTHLNTDASPLLLRARFVLIALCVALAAHAQIDTIATVQRDMTEIVVLADGETFEEYLLRQVLANAKPLKARAQVLRYAVTCTMEKDIDLKKFPHRRLITFAARLAGYGPIVTALRQHKHFGITMAEDVLYERGNITTSNVRMVEMKQQLTPKQIASFLKHDGMMSVNVYDKFYKKVRQKVKELQKKRHKKEATGMEYVGSYNEGQRTFYIVRLDNMTVHIADGCWQIAQISYDEGENSMRYEFVEVLPDLFLLSHGRARFYIDKVKWPKGYISMRLDYTWK